MSIHIALNHLTKYDYERPISLGPQTIRLRPAPHCRSKILSYSLKVLPENHFINWQQDPQGNYLARIVFPDKTDHFHVEVDLIVDQTIINPFNYFLEEYAEKYPFEYESQLEKELKPFLELLPSTPLFDAFLKAVSKEKQRTIDFLVGLNVKLNHHIEYLIRMEPGVQSPEDTLSLKKGSCRDSAWLMVNLLRHLGLAARFVSGYLIQLKPDQLSLDGPSGAAQDFTDLHAWVEVYLPGAGWIGLDPTSGLLTGEGHIPLVATPEPSSAAPISGLLEACRQTFSHEMNVTRIHEDPRVTKPFSDPQWNEILTLGDQVEEVLQKQNVKLTMGGEPTFVAIDDIEAPEWNTTALSEKKWNLALDLFYRLRSKWTKGSLIYSGQGKWYPGEPLPRWVLGSYFRKDGKPIWKNEKLFADIRNHGKQNTADAKLFLEKLCENLNVDSKFILPGYEDSWYHLWREKRLPVNVDPLNSNLKDELERKRLAKIFSVGLNEVVGYAIPLLNNGDHSEIDWISDQWYFTADHMYLIPGDSPMGLRLPLDSLPWSKPEDLKQSFTPDPFTLKGEFKESALGKGKSKSTKKTSEKSAPPQKLKSAKDQIRTALCIQVRQGHIHLFLPPISKMEEYFDLIHKIETTAESLKLPVVIEGYAPPFDPRVDNFKITPDPGVIEVNVNPVSNWRDLVSQVTSLYSEAFLSRLRAEKFMMDGKHTGTGGGNHIVLGAALPEDSPFLKRPDLLSSMVAYWNNHPSLSYLFSGTFIGPTSQAPRVDEGRRDSIYELEIAMSQVKSEIKKYGQCPPWITDRIFRHLLVDGTGNTHRSEFCIDKLYSPDSSTGRLGLLELRGFEMPPHERMSLIQQLLIRACIAKFWSKPYEEKLVRWNTSLHDRFLLPQFVKSDFKDVLADLKTFGFDFKMEYFAPHFEFRFPVIGELIHDTISIELRTAIDPWYVMGEEPAGGGMSRFVDSSVERLQVKASGMTGGRYLLICNGHRLPLQTTGVEGEFVAGVRYRAWQPPSCLHPTIPVHAPLTIELIDTWNMKSVGGCKYYVSHPGGRSFETLPINAYEAEGRRVSMYSLFGHSPGKMNLPEETNINPDYPMTLDLRHW